jgi:hypothetical protein
VCMVSSGCLSVCHSTVCVHGVPAGPWRCHGSVRLSQHCWALLLCCSPASVASVQNGLLFNFFNLVEYEAGRPRQWSWEEGQVASHNQCRTEWGRCQCWDES